MCLSLHDCNHYNTHCKRINYFHKQNRHHSERQSAQKTHPAINIKCPFGVIPPALMKHFFQKPRSKIFQNTRYNHSGRKQRKHIFNITQKYQNQPRSHTVYRAKASVQKAAVHKFSVLYRIKNTLICPSDKAIHYKTQKITAHHHKL